MEPVSGGACRYVFEDQPLDAFQFQFYKVIQSLFSLSSWLYPPSLSIINNSSSYLDASVGLTEEALTYLVTMVELGCPDPMITLNIHLLYFHHTLLLSFFLFFCLLRVGFSSHESPIGQKHRLRRKTEDFYFVWGQTINVSGISLIFLRSWGCHRIFEPLPAGQRLEREWSAGTS